MSSESYLALWPWAIRILELLGVSSFRLGFFRACHECNYRVHRITLHGLVWISIERQLTQFDVNPRHDCCPSQKKVYKASERRTNDGDGLWTDVRTWAVVPVSQLFISGTRHECSGPTNQSKDSSKLHIKGSIYDCIHLSFRSYIGASVLHNYISIYQSRFN